MRRALSAVGPIALLAAAWSCSMFPDLKSAWQLPQRTAPTQPIPVVTSGELSVGARAAYRLVLAPGLADLPSRLLVLQVRVASSGDAALTIDPQDISFTLPNGASGRVFDRPRAVEVLHRTLLADADWSYLQSAGDHPPGGLDDAERSGLVDVILGNLLADQAFGGGDGAQGFIVVDTGAPLPSLDGATLQIVAHRLRDSSPVTAPYQFTAAPTAAAASKTPAS